MNTIGQFEEKVKPFSELFSKFSPRESWFMKSFLEPGTTHINQENGGGLYGDFRSPDEQTTFELKVDGYSARMRTGHVFIEFCECRNGTDKLPSGLLTSRAHFYLIPVVTADSSIKLCKIATSKLLLLTFHNFELTEKTTAIGANGNRGQFKTSGLLLPIQSLLENSVSVTDLPATFFADWSAA